MVGAQLAASEVINAFVDSGDVVLLSVCVEGATPQWKSSRYPGLWIDAADKSRAVVGKQLYMLPALPVLYLLDAERRVVLKDTSVDQIEAFLSGEAGD